MAHNSLPERPRKIMTTANLRKRLVMLVTMSIMAIGTLAFLLLFGPGEYLLPSIPVFDRSGPSVTLRQGTFIGVDVKTDAKALEQFLGIPYALSTGGDRRFKPPVPVTASTESYDASSYGNVCPAGPRGAMSQDEDCLNVNIYRPKKRDPDRILPVLIHIYGGAFNFGAGHNRNIANMVAWSEKPFIGISFNYRVGAFGFLPSKVTEKEGLLNAGLKDQALLFEWVQENIAKFGGDPNDVTLMGQSAGGHSVCSLSLLFVAPKGLLSYWKHQA
jgi:acetylcholinesterase